jgi:hypothetical protein
MASIPKRPDLTGNPDQVFKFANFMDHLIGGIRAGTIAAIGTVSPGLLTLQYLYAPTLHCNLDGKPIAIVGNCSNKPGEFTMIKIDVASIRDFPHFKDQKKMDATFTQSDTIPTDWLAGTIWAESEAPIVGTIVPNFFIVYFGQDPP